MKVHSRNLTPVATQAKPAKKPRSPSPRKPESLRVRLRHATVEAILDATQEVLIETGGKASVGAIAAHAGIAVGTLYNHFRDRDQLIQALLRQRYEEFANKLDASLLADDKRGFEVHLRQFVLTMLTHFDTNRRYLKLVLSTEIARLSDKGDPRHPMNQFHRRIVPLFERGVREGLIAKDDPELLAAMLMGTLRGYLLSNVDDDNFVFADYADRIVNIFLHGALIATAHATQSRSR